MLMTEVTKYLEHHGVKGMRWGVRKKRGAPSADVQTHSSNKKKHVSELDDKDLQKLVNRINMEQQYSRLTTKPSKLKKGHNVVKGILAAGVTINTAIAFANTPTGKTIAKQLNKEKALSGLKALG